MWNRRSQQMPALDAFTSYPRTSAFLVETRFELSSVVSFALWPSVLPFAVPPKTDK